MITIVIVTEDVLKTKRIGNLLDNWLKGIIEKIKVIYFQSGGELLEYLITESSFPDVILLDMQISHIDGIETAKQLRIINKDCIIIFINSYWDKVYESFKVNAFQYILIDELEHYLSETLNSALELLNDQDTYFQYTFGKNKFRVLYRNIIYFESKKRIINIVTNNPREINYFYKRMDILEKELNGKHFIRCHQSFIVNKAYIEDLEDDVLTLADGNKLPISKRYKRNVVDAI